MDCRFAVNMGTAVTIATALLVAAAPLVVAGEAETNSAPSGEPSFPAKWNATWTDRLKKDLLSSYDKFARPAEHTNTTVVNIDLTLRHVEMDELKALMTVYCWVKMFWSDEKLRWNSSDYGGLTRLYLADHEIWQPDIVLYNSATGTEVDHYGNTHSIVHEDGTVLWVPPSLFRVFCDLNLRLWPYDEQTCILRLGSWTYDGDQVDLQLDEHEAEMDLMVPNTEWEITSLTRKRNVAYYSCCTEAYIDVTFTLTLKRRSPTYNAIVITPASVIVVMTLMTFWLPPNASEKLMLGGCTSLIICIFLLYFSQMLPAMANHTPLVVTFYSSSLILVTVSMIVSVAVLNLSRPFHVMSVPWPIKSTLTGMVGRVLGLGNYISLATAQHHGILGSNAGEELREQHLDDPSIEERHMIPVASQGTGSSSHRSTHYDWILFAAAVDRVAFLVYCLLFGILAAVYV